MTTTRRQERRTTSATRTQQTPLQGELIFETDTGKLYIGDGTTPGGVLATQEYASSDFDHNQLTNGHNLTTDINHNNLTNTHNLTTDIVHQNITGAGTNTHAQIDSHISNILNPHQVTKTQVGLSEVDNTSDLNKPISTLTQTALNAKQATLVSGTNIKTINNNSLLGSGDIEISGSSFFVVVATDGSGDYNCDGTADQVQIQAALDSLTNGGMILLKQGTYNISAVITMPSNVILSGVGFATKIQRVGAINFLRNDNQVVNSTIQNLRLLEDAYDNIPFSFPNKTNKQLYFNNLLIDKTPARVIYVGGSYTCRDIWCLDIQQFLGTPDYYLDESFEPPTIVIDNCHGENVSFKLIGDNEFIDINNHHSATCQITNCTSRGFGQNHFEVNCSNFTVTNCIAYVDGMENVVTFTTTLKSGGTGDRLVRGSFVNCHVEGLGANSDGFYVSNIMNGVNFVGCSAEGNDAVTPVGYGFVLEGGSSIHTRLTGCLVKNCATGVYLNNRTVRLTGVDFENCTTNIDGIAGSYGVVQAELTDKTQYFNGWNNNGSFGSTGGIVDFNNNNFQGFRLGSSNVAFTTADLRKKAGIVYLRIQQTDPWTRAVTFPANMIPKGESFVIKTGESTPITVLSFFFDGTNYYEI